MYNDSRQALHEPTARAIRHRYAPGAAAVSLAIGGTAFYLATLITNGLPFDFPIDDAWIHLTYARNLAQRLEFSFLPGQPSAGSTSPLWDGVIALGMLLRLDGIGWTYIAGALSLAAVSLLAMWLAAILFPEHAFLPLAAGVMIALEWHLTWAALSGMETVFFTALALLLLIGHQLRWPFFWLGVIGALLTATRPEGALLVALVSLDLIAGDLHRARQLQSIVRRCVLLLVGFLAPLLPYVTFNLVVSGFVFPNTLYAKQQEYAFLYKQFPLGQLALILFLAPVEGAQYLLIPGFVVTFVHALRERSARLSAPLSWWAAIPLLYLVRLPVTYHHGRYEMPIIPLFIVFGIAGTMRILATMQSVMWRRVLSRTFAISTAVLLIVYAVSGSSAYARDVALTSCQYTQMALWLRSHTPPGSLVALSSIGAAGYFSERPLLDMEGLITPEVIPFFLDHPRLWEFMQARHASYMVAEPSFFPSIVADRRVTMIYQLDCPITASFAAEPQAVYRLDLAR